MKLASRMDPLGNALCRYSLGLAPFVEYPEPEVSAR